jgi:toxin CcdB
MARYDVFAAPRAPDTPYLLDVQTDLLSGINTRVVVPLMRQGSFARTHNRLHPEFFVRDQRVVMATHLIVAVPATVLRKPIGTLEEAHFEIVTALDMLFQGV